MLLFSSIIIGIMFTVAIYLILENRLLPVLFGFGLLTHAANLAILTMSKNPVGKVAPIIKDGVSNYIDPLPQALILTAIVIGFGVTAFLVVLIYRIYTASGSTKISTIFNEETHI
ncbi:Na(+)/H(+) antiporter subunit C [bacterium]|jgi:multicomponent Na+:H+ antiporter subunit C|nr:Na(+)/H(+) antiporter subunit C [bacterium]